MKRWTHAQWIVVGFGLCSCWYALQLSGALVYTRGVLNHPNKSNSVTQAPPKYKTDVVMFIPTPVQWAHRRAAVHAQFAKEGWTDEQVVLLFVVGEWDAEVSKVEQYAHARYVAVPCHDEGDRFDEPDDKSATTCKVYNALKHVASHYEAKYVWRGADDSYVNLPFFFKMAHTLPSQRLFYGRLRRAPGISEDLQLARQPRLQEVFGMYQFGQYMYGMGFLFSYDVVDFVGSLKIPPHLTWCTYNMFLCTHKKQH
jgi:hypothetical protein